MEFIVVIPARFASMRLPGKPLALIGDKPMIQHVYERCRLANAARVIIATDDERIAKAASEFGAEVCMTAAEHQSGSDRLAEVCRTLNFSDDDIVVNVQGDEPFISPLNIEQVALGLANSKSKMATLSTPITSDEEVFNSNVVKVVSNNNDEALYFSRAPIAWQRGSFEQKEVKDLSHCQRHIGIYAYRAGFLADYVKLPVSTLEQLESLEQLRVLENGYSIHIEPAKEAPGMGIDTQEDLAQAQITYKLLQL
ncbi:3-deoxy-manno-octulosonate cytidylyltransferase [Kangiella sp. HZ709]|uniref:3-deoxy-manno-octulosonate cytidylyltransferase n=1 Tax=Kangiella sp. HZ709 TaxID=2666328 RepID=UPI0012AFEED1|nr:3-deoxy-manno-octulosonate cytidylyltransferase [Kangiella sp. HZ709]MRX26817.1 3-deoxy-manno-octulosonate cytidylyltransferase [Kangiella sp. HZ709]